MAHPEQSDAMGFLEVVAGRNADTIVPDGQFQHPLAHRQRHLHMQGLRVPVHVQQRFLRDPHVHERGIRAWERMLAAAKAPQAAG